MKKISNIIHFKKQTNRHFVESILIASTSIGIHCKKRSESLFEYFCIQKLCLRLQSSSLIQLLSAKRAIHTVCEYQIVWDQKQKQKHSKEFLFLLQKKEIIFFLTFEKCSFEVLNNSSQPLDLVERVI